MSAFVIALLGAESTGKTTLAAALGQTFRSSGKTAAVVDEYLREFCDQHARTPTQAEQHHIACEQTRRIEEMAQRLDVTPHTVKIWRRAGLLRAHSFGDKPEHLFEPPGADAPLKARHKGLGRTLKAAKAASSSTLT